MYLTWGKRYAAPLPDTYNQVRFHEWESIGTLRDIAGKCRVPRKHTSPILDQEFPAMIGGTQSVLSPKYIV